MTDEEKKLKKYLKAVRRRLNLPREIRDRVMSDFESGFQARRESGMTDETIYAELGTPEKAAADLNEQMREYAYQKSPWRFLFLACSIYGAVKLLPALWINLYYLVIRAKVMLTTAEAASIGVIGGADGPTAVFVTSPVWVYYSIPVLMLAVGIWGFLHFSRQKMK